MKTYSKERQADPPVRYYLAICPASGMQIRLKFEGEAGGDNERLLTLPAVLTDDLAPSSCVACSGGVTHDAVEITLAAYARLDEMDDEA